MASKAREKAAKAAASAERAAKAVAERATKARAAAEKAAKQVKERAQKGAERASKRAEKHGKAIKEKAGKAAAHAERAAKAVKERAAKAAAAAEKSKKAIKEKAAKKARQLAERATKAAQKAERVGKEAAKAAEKKAKKAKEIATKVKEKSIKAAQKVAAKIEKGAKAVRGALMKAFKGLKAVYDKLKAATLGFVEFAKAIGGNVLKVISFCGAGFKGEMKASQPPVVGINLQAKLLGYRTTLKAEIDFGSVGNSAAKAFSPIFKALKATFKGKAKRREALLLEGRLGEAEEATAGIFGNDACKFDLPPLGKSTNGPTAPKQLPDDKYFKCMAPKKPDAKDTGDVKEAEEKAKPVRKKKCDAEYAVRQNDATRL